MNIKLKNLSLEQKGQNYVILEADLKRIKEILEMKMMEIDELKDKNQRSELKMREMASLNNKLNESEQKIRLLINENERQNSIMKQKNNEIDDWKRKLREIEIVFSDSNNLQKELFRLKFLITKNF